MFGSPVYCVSRFGSPVYCIMNVKRSISSIYSFYLERIFSLSQEINQTMVELVFPPLIHQTLRQPNLIDFSPGGVHLETRTLARIQETRNQEIKKLETRR